MAAKKYLSLDAANGAKQVAAVASSAGGSNDGDLVALDSAGLLSETMMPLGVTPSYVDVVASENLTTRDLVNLWDDAGTLKARQASQASGNNRRCHGFVAAAVTSGNTGRVFLSGGKISGLSSRTPAAVQYLGTDGAITETVPTGSGVYSQEVGIALSATVVAFNPYQGTQLA